MTPQSIIQACADAAGVTPADVVSKDRTLKVTAARHVAAFVMRRMGMTLKATGAALNRDHTTVLEANRRVEIMLEKLDFHLTKPSPFKPRRYMTKNGNSYYSHDKFAILAAVYAYVCDIPVPEQFTSEEPKPRKVKPMPGWKARQLRRERERAERMTVHKAATTSTTPTFKKLGYAGREVN